MRSNHTGVPMPAAGRIARSAARAAALSAIRLPRQMEGQIRQRLNGSFMDPHSEHGIAICGRRTLHRDHEVGTAFGIAELERAGGVACQRTDAGPEYEALRRRGL